MATYCEVVDVSAAGRLNITGTAYDDALLEIITAASSWIDNHCRLPDGAFAATSSATRYYRQSDIGADGVLRLDAPLVSLTTLTNGNGATITSTYYWTIPRNSTPKLAVQLKSTASWQWATDGEISIAGVWGWSATPPDVVREACAMLAAWIFKRYQSAMQDATANFDLGQLVYAQPFPLQVAELLKPFRRMV